jgi:uncharacterized membrane protein
MLARAGLTAAAYVITTAVFNPISFGAVQFRVSEALCILPLLFPECAVGLTLGCLISNAIFSTPIDVILGTLATAIAAGLTVLCGLKIKKTAPKLILGELPPILANAFIVPFTFMTATDTVGVYFFNALTVGLGELGVIAILGTLLYFTLLRIKIGKKNN